MRKHTQLLTVLVMLLALFFTGSLAGAASIKERMASRIPAINALKDQGLVGENNGGYLEYRSSNRPSQDVVSAENNDRKSVYSAIAKKEGASAELVGQRRAKMIADNGKSGHWFQSPDGSWYTK